MSLSVRQPGARTPSPALLHPGPIAHTPARAHSPALLHPAAHTPARASILLHPDATQNSSPALSRSASARVHLAPDASPSSLSRSASTHLAPDATYTPSSLSRSASALAGAFTPLRHGGPSNNSLRQSGSRTSLQPGARMSRGSSLRWSRGPSLRHVGPSQPSLRHAGPSNLSLQSVASEDSDDTVTLDPSNNSHNPSVTFGIPTINRPVSAALTVDSRVDNGFVFVERRRTVDINAAALRASQRYSWREERELAEAMALALQETGGFSMSADRVGRMRSMGNLQDISEQSEEPKFPRGSGTRDDPYVVAFSAENDPEDPMQWPVARKWFIVALTALSTLCVSFSSSAFAGAIVQMTEHFHTAPEVMLLGLSLFVLGFALGPLLWAPLSEMYGRRRLFMITYGPFFLFHIAAALSPNLTSLLVFRLLGGIFGSSPLTNSGGVVSDLFSAYERGLAMSLFALAPFAGPVLGPVVGGFVGQYLDFRWEFWVMAIFSGVMLFLNIFWVPETYAPVLLRWRAQKLARKTNGKRAKPSSEHYTHFISVYDVTRPKGQTFASRLRTTMVRPFVLLFKEMICFLLAVYAALVYGTLYLCFEAFPIVFQEERHWSGGLAGLSFLGIGVGMVIGVGLNVAFNARYIKQLQASPHGYLPPEARLPAAMLGALLLPVGLFTFAWTTFPKIHFIVPIVATVPFGCGMVMIFLSMMSYLVDAYLIYAASALAANAVLRSICGAVFPLFATQMYEKLGTQWASTVVAIFALLFAPIPFLFYKYGRRIRRSSKFAADPVTPDDGDEEEAKQGKQSDEVEMLAGMEKEDQQPRFGEKV